MTTRNWQILQTITLLTVVCPVGLRAQAKGVSYDVTAPPAGTSTYVFARDASTVVQTGGIAGTQITYSIEGQFQLTIHPETGTASFAHVHVKARSIGGHVLDVGRVFDWTELMGTVLNDGSIRFEGTADDGSDILITLTFEDDLVYLKGQTTPPVGSADFFIYTLDAVARRKYGGGTGEPTSPYLIYTAEQMNAIGDHPTDLDKHFKLMADIDLSGFDGNEGRPAFNLIAPDIDLIALGYQGIPFAGVFDGNGHTISHLTLAGGAHLGLFCYLDFTAEVKDLGVVDVDIAGSCYAVGGLVGENHGDVTACYSTGTVNGEHVVGGLVGLNLWGIVSQCHSASVVGATGWYIGGLVGWDWDNLGVVTACFWDTDTSGQPTSAGGTGKTTAEMNTRSTFTDAGWDFENIWWMPDNDYPRLLWERTDGGPAEPGALSSDGLDMAIKSGLVY